jgi:hypothetical protein
VWAHRDRTWEWSGEGVSLAVMTSLLAGPAVAGVEAMARLGSSMELAAVRVQGSR